MYKLNFGESLIRTTSLWEAIFINAIPSFKPQGQFIISTERLTLRKLEENMPLEHLRILKR